MKHRTRQSNFPRLCEETADAFFQTRRRAQPAQNLCKSDAENRCREFVVLLHGLFATRRSMHKLACCLNANGYQVINWGYPTFLRSTAEHVENLLKTVQSLQADPQVGAIHFVTHSMGGILARGALHFGSGEKVQRIVMLSPPNTGSKLTRFPLGPFGWCCPAIADLAESPDSLPNRMHKIADAQIGIIAAEHDYVVPLPNTLLPAQRDHCVIPTTHVRILRHADAQHQVLHFLAYGRFQSHAGSPYSRSARSPNSTVSAVAG